MTRSVFLLGVIMPGLVRPTLYWLYGMGLLWLMIAFDSYCFFENKSNHTGAPMDFFAVVYSLSAVIALLLHRRRFMLPVERWSLRFVALVGIAGALNLIALDRLDVMSEYEAWSRRGNPEKPAWARPARPPRGR